MLQYFETLRLLWCVQVIKLKTKTKQTTDQIKLNITLERSKNDHRFEGFKSLKEQVGKQKLLIKEIQQNQVLARQSQDSATPPPILDTIPNPDMSGIREVVATLSQNMSSLESVHYNHNQTIEAIVVKLLNEKLSTKEFKDNVTIADGVPTLATNQTAKIHELTIKQQQYDHRIEILNRFSLSSYDLAHSSTI